MKRKDMSLPRYLPTDKLDVTDVGHIVELSDRLSDAMGMGSIGASVPLLALHEGNHFGTIEKIVAYRLRGMGLYSLYQFICDADVNVFVALVESQPEEELRSAAIELLDQTEEDRRESPLFADEVHVIKSGLLV